jgi:hypothetical protein
MYPNAFRYLGIGSLLRYVNAELALLFPLSKNILRLQKLCRDISIVASKL